MENVLKYTVISTGEEIYKSEDPLVLLNDIKKKCL